MPRMKGWDECYTDQTISRQAIDHSKICTFGIKALDDALIGILRNDLVVIGADSGIGKSDICLNLALHNAKNGKNVALFFIEGGSEEAISRIKWKAIKDKYYDQGHNTVELDYRKWKMGLLENTLLLKIESEVYNELNEAIGSRLHIYEIDSTFKIDDLTNSIGYFASKRINNEHRIEEHFYDVDLIIVDHLQYFTLTNPKNELGEMTQILMKVKEITDFHKIPVILVSHLRKKDKDRGLPGQDDFYGTGNICKISSIAITISNHPQKDDHSNELYPTFFRIVKSRTGIRSSYAILCDYMYKLGHYDTSYQLYNLIADKPTAEPIEADKLPKWAKPMVKIEVKPIISHKDWVK